MTDIINLLCDFLFGSPIVIGGTITECCSAIAWVVPAIAAAVSALSAGGSAIAGANANKKSQRILDDRERENEAMYLAEYYRGALDNEGSRAYLKRLDEKMEEKNAAVDNAAVATGATQENTLAAKQANNEVLSDAVAGLVEKEDNRKLSVQDRYFNNKGAIQNARMSNNAAVANNWAGIGAGISSAAGSLASAYMMGDSGTDNTADNIRRFYQLKRNTM